jgi:hypothetical protein
VSLQLRFLRAGLVGAVAAWLGTAAHVAAGGRLPGPVPFLVVLALVVLGTAALLGRPAGRLVLVGCVAGGQVVVHLALTALAGHGSAPSPSLPPAPAAAGERRGSLYDLTVGARPAASGGTPGWVQHLVADFSGPHALMAVLHLLAAAGVGLWLAAGERALCALLAAVACAVRVPVLASPVARVPRRPGRPACPRAAVPLPGPLLGALGRRGPPVAVA